MANEKKKSFIFYADQEDVINLLSNEQAGIIYKAIYAYVNRNELPELDSEAKIVFTVLKNQIDRDTEHWNEIKERRALAGKKHAGNQYTNGTNGTNVPSVPTLEQNGTNGTVNVNVNVNDNVNVNENENVNVNENVMNTASPLTLSSSQENYSEQIYKLWKDANLPIERDLFQFQCGGFKQSLSHIWGIHSDDVIQACKNYIKELKKSSSYITNQYRFERFVSIPSFKDFLPEFYRSKNFQKIGNGNNPVIEADKIEPWKKVGMTSKEYYHVQTVEDLLREKEEEERLKAEQTAVNQ